MVFKIPALFLMMAFSTPAAIIYSFSGTTTPLANTPSSQESFSLTTPDYLVIPNDSSAFLYRTCGELDRNQNCGLGVYFSEQSILGPYSANLQFDDNNNTGYVYYFLAGAFEHPGVYISQDLGNGSTNFGVLTVTDTSNRTIPVTRPITPNGQDPGRNGSTPPIGGGQNGGNNQNPGGNGAGNTQSPGGNGQGGSTQPGGSGQGNQDPSGGNQNPGSNGGAGQNPGGNGNTLPPAGNDPNSGSTQPGGSGAGQTDPTGAGSNGGTVNPGQAPLSTPEPASFGVTLLALFAGAGAYRMRRRS